MYLGPMIFEPQFERGEISDATVSIPQLCISDEVVVLQMESSVCKKKKKITEWKR